MNNTRSASLPPVYFDNRRKDVKKQALCALIIPLLFPLFAGCGGEGVATTVVTDATDPVSQTTVTDTVAQVTETDPVTQTDPVTDTDTETEAVISDPSKKTLVIEDFNAVSDPVKEFTMPDLSVFGIAYPDYSENEALSLEGKAMLAVLRRDTWCQVYEIRGEKLSVFREADGGDYLRMYVCTPDYSSLGLTFCLGTEGGSNRSYLAAGAAVVTDISGRRIDVAAGNDTDDAGPGSSLRVPAGFCGYVALPLGNTAAWRGSSGISDIKNTDYLKIDVRPSPSDDGDRYVFDALCLSDSPTAELYPERSGADGESFGTKNEEVEFMLTEILQKEPTFEYCPEYDPAGFPEIKALWLDGAKYGGKDTKVFAYIGFPENASESDPVPGVVLLHGGGGYAYPSWVKIWNDRGFAAIAVGNTGYFPVKEGITDFYSAQSFTRTISAETLAKDPRVMPPDNDGMYSSQGRVDRMWMYHAVAQTILCNSLLRADPRVDADKVGVTGISWGGVIASTAIGYDPRFAFAVPVYGSGYLDEAHSWMHDNYNAPGTKELWEPSLRFENVKTPVLWLCWADDNCFSVNSNSKSCLAVKNSTLSVIQGLGHGHLEGWSREEIYRFAKWATGSGEPLPSPLTLPGKGRDISFTVTVPADARSVSARVLYITEPLSYSPDGRLHINGQNTIDQEWHAVACKVEGGNVTATLPDDAHSYYVEISAKCGGKTYITSTPFTDAD